MERLSARTLSKLRLAIGNTQYTSERGATHNFYHYPARFSPEVARAVVETFSRPGEWVLDPFMGGGTAVIEGLMLGRRVIGVDINALAKFIADTRTRPLSKFDESAIRLWVSRAVTELERSGMAWVEPTQVRNLPRPVEMFVGGALDLSAGLLPRQQSFARCALLRLGQWALDCRDFAAPRRRRLARTLAPLVEDMLDGLQSFTKTCRSVGVPKNEITSRRILLHRSAVGLEADERISEIDARPRLVFTSPPYPGVHVLYHRWQYRGRKETAAPYWIASVPDGHGPSFYCGGSRTPTGLRNYFEMITDAFRSVRGVIHPHGVVVQLVGFSDLDLQLPLYLQAMTAAGFRESVPTRRSRLDRAVPHRKWYAKLKGDVDAATEVLLIHAPR